MIGKSTPIRYQFLIAINLVLTVIFLLFGFTFWSEWGRAAKSLTEEIRQHSVQDSRHNLLHGFEIYDGEIKFQFRQMEQLAESFSRSEEFQSRLLNNRRDVLKQQLSLETDRNIFDFANILNVEGEIIANYPERRRGSGLDVKYRDRKGPIRRAIEQLSSDPQHKKDRISSSYFQISRDIGEELGIHWENDGPEYEFVLLTVAKIYTDAGEPAGILVFGKLFRSLAPIFDQIKERTKIDYSVYTLKQTSITTGLHHHSPLRNNHIADFKTPGPYVGTYYVQHHGGNLLCSEIRIGENPVAGLTCTGMPTAMANLSANHIEVIFEDLKGNIALWYAVLGFLALIFATILAFFLSRRLTNPLETITHAIEKLARNDLHIDLPEYPGSKEINTISKATEVFKRNIQAMSEVEIKLRDQREEALMSSRIKSQFLGNMGHDLRTPLNAIIGFSELLSKEIFGKLGHDKYREYSKDIHFSGRHLLELINNILDVSSIESGKFTMNESWFYLPDVINQSTHLHQFLADQSDVRLKAKIDEGVSELYGDPLRFQQILNNLISNAIKFTPSTGKVDIYCTIDLKGHLLIKIEDTGTGISDLDLDQIFEPFFLGDDMAVTPQRGTGLGLFLVKSFVDFHNGHVTVESEVGEGTCFILTFPENRLRAPDFEAKALSYVT